MSFNTRVKVKLGIGGLGKRFTHCIIAGRGRQQEMADVAQNGLSMRKGEWYTIMNITNEVGKKGKLPKAPPQIGRRVQVKRRWKRGLYS